MYSGFESASKQYCPPSLLQKADYTYYSPGSAATCTGSTENWDVCSDRQIMTFDYSSCAQKMAYSGTCMDSIQSHKLLSGIHCCCRKDN